MNLYFDESIHEQCGFMIVAFVACQHDPQDELRTIIQEYGDIEEFHSCERMDINQIQQNLRDSMRNFINSHCKWGIMIFPSSMRWKIAEELLGFLIKLQKTIKLDSLFFDKSLLKQDDIANLQTSLCCNSITINCSKNTMGIQLADLVASNCGIRLKSHLTRKHKILKYGHEEGYPYGIEAELSWELWAWLRHSMFKNGSMEDEDYISGYDFDTKDKGYFISNKCDTGMKTVADKLFDTVYIGCIH